jgi:hypothetical protein
MRSISGSDLGLRRALSFVPPSAKNYWFQLVANTAQTLEIPEGAKYAIFSFPEDVYAVRWHDSEDDDAIAIPTASGWADDDLHDYCPTQREISHKYMTILSPSAQGGLVSFYGD